MHLPVMIPLGGRLYIDEGLEIGLQGVMMDVSKSWICESWVDLCELHMPSCIQLCFAQSAPKRA